VLLDNVSLGIGRNDRIALIGENGCGKTTLLRLITGEEACDSGLVKVSSNVEIVYLPQIIRFDSENATVFETLRSAIELPEDKVRSILAGFKFKTSDIMKKVSSLSGGERSRLKLCLLMQSKANFLILDEPTNHLDIDSREWIEEAVSDWDCSMLFISHDRYFLNKFASKVWSMKDGMISVFNGGFDAYLEMSAGERSNATSSGLQKKKTSAKAKKQSDKTGKSSEKPQKQPKNAKKSKNSPMPQASPESLISESEAELSRLNEEIESCLQGSDYQRINSLYRKKHLLEEHITGLYENWDSDK
jgi:ATPase subunit of ABC transporter with duplicated ATPase domains